MSERILERMKEELTLSSPNKTMIIVGLMLQGEYLSSTKVMERFSQFTEEQGVADIKITQGLFSNSIHRWLKAKAPIMRYIEKNKDAHYRINPLLSRVALTDVFELTKKTGKFSERDLMLRIPELAGTEKVESKPNVNTGRGSSSNVISGDVREIHVKVTFGPIRVIFGFEK